jgi:glutaconate CoA-transferase, subunit A
MTGPAARAGGPAWVSTVEELVSGISDGERVAVSGFHFVRAPIAQLRSLIARRPQGLTYVSWGGGLPLELLLAAGSLSRVMFCFSSMDVFGLAPRFRRALELGSVVADEWTALALIKGLEAAGQGMGFEVLQQPAGSDVFPGREAAVVGPFGSGGPPLVAVPAVPVDSLLLHAQRADEMGNVEISGGRGLDMATIFAARKVLVTAEQCVPAGGLGGGRSYVLPRSFVTAITMAPGGAHPTSCLPYYGTDYRTLQRFVDLAVDAPVEEVLSVLGEHHPAPVLGEIARGKIPGDQAAASFGPRRSGAASPSSYTVDELMTCLLAREVTDTSICSVGSVSPLATAAYFLAKRTSAPRACILTHNGGYLDVGLRPMCLLAAEAFDYASCVAFAGGDETYHNFYQRGSVTHEVVSAAQVDRRGATNNVRIARADGFLRLPGQGGMADVANLHANFMLYLTRHSPRSLVDEVATVSAARQWHGTVRRGLGLADGSVVLVTNLGRFAYDEGQGELVLTHVHPGVSTEEVAQQTGFALRVAAELRQSAPPTAEELRVLRNEVDPLGLRRLEFVPAAERRGLIDELLASEEDALGRTLAATLPGPPTIERPE